MNNDPNSNVFPLRPDAENSALDPQQVGQESPDEAERAVTQDTASPDAIDHFAPAVKQWRHPSQGMRPKTPPTAEK